jgi:2,5-diamino-6-(ribosylamino)-4(3H)-pyrimidinone 5'-phosphate reductase
MLPRVILHNAVSLDGRIDWIAADVGLFYELAARWSEDASLAGSDTMLNPPDEVPPEDDSAFEPPQRDPGDRRPLLVIPDSRGRVRTWHFWRRQPYWRDMLALCSRATPREYLDYLEKRHVEYIVAGDDRVDLRRALEELNARYGVRVVRADSGGTLNGVLLRAGLVDEVSLLVHPSLVGGVSPRSMFRAADLTGPEGVIPLRLTHVEQLSGDVVWLRYEVVKR